MLVPRTGNMCFQDSEALVRSFGNQQFSNWEPVVPRLGSIDSNGWEPLVLRTGDMCFQDCLGTSSSSNWEAVRHFFFEYLLLYVIGQYVWFNHAPSFCGRSLLAGLLRTHRWYRTNKQNTAIFLSNMFFVSVQYAALVFHQCLS